MSKPARDPRTTPKVGDRPILDQVKAWEDLFFSLYKRKPRMIEREQYFIGRIHGMQSLSAVQKAEATK